MSGVLLLWESTKEQLDKLQAAVQDYMCKVLKECPPAGVPKGIILDALVDFFLNKDLAVLLTEVKLRLEEELEELNKKDRLVSVRVKDETKDKLEALRNKIIEGFTRRAQNVDIPSGRIAKFRDNLRTILSYTRLVHIIISIFNPEEMEKEVADAMASNKKISPHYYRFINIVKERLGRSIHFIDPLKEVQLTLSEIEKQEEKKRKAEALRRRGMELLQRLEGRPIRTTLMVGYGWRQYLAVPKDIGLLRNLYTILEARVIEEGTRLVADVEFTLGGRLLHLERLRIKGYVASDFKHLIPPGWRSGGLPVIIIGEDRDLPPDLKSILDPVVKPPSSIDVDATIRIYRVKEV
jgi:hypothetical protein